MYKLREGSIVLCGSSLILSQVKAIVMDKLR